MFPKINLVHPTEGKNPETFVDDKIRGLLVTSFVGICSQNLFPF
jgi:hypothetical protein